MAVLSGLVVAHILRHVIALRVHRQSPHGIPLPQITFTQVAGLTHLGRTASSWKVYPDGHFWSLSFPKAA